MIGQSDSELLALYIGSNDQAAFGEIYERHHRDLQKYLIRRAPASDAADLLQEVFICVWRLHHTYTPGSNVGAWLQTIAKNRLKNHWRDENRVRRCPTGPTVSLSRAVDSESPDWNFADDSAIGADEMTLTSELAARAKSLVPDLPIEEREPVQLIFFERMKYRDAAERLRIPVGTLKSRMMRGVKRLGGWLNLIKFKGVA